MARRSLARGRLDGGALVDVKDLVVPDAYEGNSGLGGRIVFGRDGMIYFATGGNIAEGRRRSPAACAARSCGSATTARSRRTTRS